MGRHRTPEEKRELGEKARAMREQGLSRPEIKKALGVGEDTVKALLRGTPVPDSLRRPRAKDDLRAAAVALRREGRTYDQIAAELGVSKSSCSLWLRDVPVPGRQVEGVDAVSREPLRRDDGRESPGAQAAQRRERARRLRLEGLLLSEIAVRLGCSTTTVYYDTWDLPQPPRARSRGRDPEALHADLKAFWERERARRAEIRREDEATHAAAVPPIDRHVLVLLAVCAYWCEGSKSKPYAVREQVTFINSDLGLLRLWLAFLDVVQFPEEHRHFRLSIHERADVAAAERSWAEDLGVAVERFDRATLKRHNPRTKRQNTGEGYRGCVVVRLTQCADLYRLISGTWTGMMSNLPPAAVLGSDSG